MSHCPFVRAGSTLGAAALALLATGPAFAADPVAQASATALEVGVAGQGTDTGTYTATNDGTTQTTAGTRTPALPVLAGQRATNLGTLAQDATTSAAGGDGSSAACAGVAGEGATLVQVGDGTSCLTGGRTISLDAGSADFSRLRVLPAELTQGVDTTIAAAVSSAVAPVVNQLLAALGDPALVIDLGAVQASCTADGSGARGTASIADAAAYLRAPAPFGRIDLVSLPVHPAPDTHVVTDLSAVVTAVQDAVSEQLGTMLGGPDGPLAGLTLPLGTTLDTVLDQVRANVTDTLGPQLAPLQENVLDIELNRQSRPASDAIEVTALDLSLLPAARQFIDADLVSLTVGRVSCGPNGHVAPAGRRPSRRHAGRPGPGRRRPDRRPVRCRFPRGRPVAARRRRAGRPGRARRRRRRVGLPAQPPVVTATATAPSSGPARLGRNTAAVLTALQLFVAVLAGGSVIGSFVVPGSDAAAAPQYAALPPGAPIRLAMPSLHVTAPVVPIAMTGRALDPPRDYREVGWWSASAQPGAPTGQTVITGHTLHTGGASMNRLGRLAAGDFVDVISRRGRMRYAVQRSTVYSRARLAEHAEELFGQDHGRGRLVLVTCTDWDGVAYESNVVVVAKPLGSPVRQR